MYLTLNNASTVDLIELFGFNSLVLLIIADSSNYKR